MAEATPMTLNISLTLTIPDDANAQDVVYLLKAARELAADTWPGAKLKCHPIIIPGPNPPCAPPTVSIKSASTH
jgi:hypothetical protein